MEFSASPVIILFGLAMILLRRQLEGCNRKLWTSVIGEDVKMPRLMGAHAYLYAGIASIIIGLVVAATQV